jgi:acyl dehydratase
MGRELPRQGLLYEDLYVGLSFRSPGRTITDADIIGFAALTGDFSEVHTSDVYAQASQFGKRIAHGMLGLAYAHGLMWPRSEMLRRTAVAFLGISDWRFVAPIFLGDTIFVNYAVAAMRDSKSNPDQAIVTFDVEVVDQTGRLCQKGQKVELLSKVPLDGVTASDKDSGQ